MTGYLEILTDPSYAGQAVVMTYPLIGNYGVCEQDMESVKPWVDGYIIRELATMPSNFRSEISLTQFLSKHEITGIAGIDTRTLTKRLRENGTMNGMITTDESYVLEDVLAKIKQYQVQQVVKKVSSKQVTVETPDTKQANGLHVALMDFGCKKNIVHSLVKRGCHVTIYPAETQADTILQQKPDGIMLTNGPGDPKECQEIIAQIKRLADSQIPIFAICLGHQLMALAHGADTHKMKYGHRGANHPVKDLCSGKVSITSQNHGYVVTEQSVPHAVARVRFVDVNDQTIEGLSYIGKPIETVQFHPEASPGPEDTAYLFDEFISRMGGK